MEKSVMKRFLALLLALVMVFALCACSSTNEPKETQSGNEATSWDEIKPIKIVYAHANALSETNNKMVDNWMAAVEKASEGKISFDYHPGGSLGTYVEIIEQVESGAVNMSISDMSLFESYCPAFGVLYSPFIIDDYDHAKNIAYGKAGELLKADLAKDTNTYLLGMIMNGKRIVDTTVPIKSLDDCKGVIIRTPEAQVYTDTFKMLGMSPTAMSLTDTYTGIQTGTVQGFECPAQAIYNGGYHKIAPYIWKSGHMYSFQGWTANQKFWDSLPVLPCSSAGKTFRMIITTCSSPKKTTSTPRWKRKAAPSPRLTVSLSLICAPTTGRPRPTPSAPKVPNSSARSTIAAASNP